MFSEAFTTFLLYILFRYKQIDIISPSLLLSFSTSLFSFVSLLGFLLSFCAVSLSLKSLFGPLHQFARAQAGVNLSVVYGEMPEEAVKAANDRGASRVGNLKPGEKVPLSLAFLDEPPFTGVSGPSGPKKGEKNISKRPFGGPEEGPRKYP